LTPRQWTFSPSDISLTLACDGIRQEVQVLRWTHAHQLTDYTHTLTHNTHTFNGPFSGTTQVGRYEKVKPIWILLKQETVSGSGISWAMQVCTSLQTDNHASIPPLSFLQAGCHSCRPANSVKALKAQSINRLINNN